MLAQSGNNGGIDPNATVIAGLVEAFFYASVFFYCSQCVCFFAPGKLYSLMIRASSYSIIA
jgi:hypothetical protein